MAMTLDDELRAAFEALSVRLRDDLATALSQTNQRLLSAAAAEQQRAATDRDLAVAAAVEQTRAELTQAHASADEAAREALNAAVASAELRVREQMTAETDARVRAAVEDAVQQTRAERAPQPAADPVTTAADRLRDAVRALDGATSLSAVLDALAERASHEARRTVVMLSRGGRLRVWRSAGFEPTLEESGFDRPFAEAGMIGEAAQSDATRTTTGDGSAAAWPFGLGPADVAVAVPVTLGGETVALVYGDSAGAAAPLDTGAQANLDLLGRYAGRRLEALTAFMAARALFGEQASEAGRMAADAPDVDDESARRYARLLVAEIRLYHEPEVTIGRAQRDLAVRLAADIGRARALYDQRVPARIRSQSDYFRAELVRTLADGDASLLGGGLAGQPGTAPQLQGE